MATKKAPKRAAEIPEAAIWNPEQSCWEHGAIDEKGQKQGTFRSWYASGGERGSATYENDELHGPETAQRGGKTESPFDDSIDERVFRTESRFEHDVLMRQRAFTRAGAEVGTDGEPLPERPAGVPAEASYVAEAELWVDGPLHGLAELSGPQRLWHVTGELLANVSWKEGELDGDLATYRYGELGIDIDGPEGPPRTDRVEAKLQSGSLLWARFFERAKSSPQADRADAADTELAAVHFKDDALHGLLAWRVDLHDDFTAPIFRHGERTLMPRDLFLPRRLPGTARIEAKFEDGAILELHAFDASGALIPPAAPIVQWGQDATDVAGYAASGFARDLAEWFDAGDAESIDDDAARASTVFATLPEPQKASAIAFDALVRSGRFPAMRTCLLSGYGFDCVKNELYGATDARYFGLAYDLSGDLYLLDLESGRVMRWAHDRDPFEDGEEFPTLDAFAFAIVRAELAMDDRIPETEVAALFERLGFGWYALLA